MLETLMALIRRFEGLRLKPYRCPAGVPTVGYGHTGPEVTMDSPPITPKLAEEMALQDARRFSAASARLSPILLAHPDRHAAISDFCFNLGATRYKASTLRKKVEAGEWEEAKEELGKWVWANGRKLPGLVLRRQAEAALL